VAIHFKGSGFYSTDYAKKRPSSTGNTEDKPKKKEKKKKPVAGKSEH
jgi:predicted nucleic acid-binding Zn ribbon protein